MTATHLAASARRIATLAWPVFFGQLAVLAFSTVDTVLLARSSSTDLAALAVGSAAYVTVFVGLMGVVMAIGPVAGQLFGANQHAQAGRQLHQAVWVALVLSGFGCALLAWPQPFLALSQVTPAVESRVREYLGVLAFALPASLLFSAYRGFNTAVSRPRAVMVLQVGGLLLKIPLSAALVMGVPTLGLAPQGVFGAGLATLLVMWAQVLAAFVLMRRDSFYQPFELWGRGLDRPERREMVTHLRLGLPMGGSILIEVSGFSLIALFAARLGPLPVAGHQIAGNLMVLMFMMPMAIASACSTLVAQRIGARAIADARRIGWHGILLGVSMALGAALVVYLLRHTVVGWYTQDPAVIASALPLMAWVAVFHVADATQTLAGFVLRAWRVTLFTLAVYAVAVWGVGLAGGYVLAFNGLGFTPPDLQGTRGFWMASSVGLTLAAVALLGYLASLPGRQQRAAKALQANPEAQVP